MTFKDCNDGSIIKVRGCSKRRLCKDCYSCDGRAFELVNDDGFVSGIKKGCKLYLRNGLIIFILFDVVVFDKFDEHKRRLLSV